MTNPTISSPPAIINLPTSSFHHLHNAPIFLIICGGSVQLTAYYGLYTAQPEAHM